MGITGVAGAWRGEGATRNDMAHEPRRGSRGRRGTPASIYVGWLRPRARASSRRRRGACMCPSRPLPIFTTSKERKAVARHSGAALPPCRLGRISRAGVVSGAATASGKAAGLNSCWGLVVCADAGFYPVIEFVWSTVPYHERSAASNLSSRGRVVTVFASATQRSRGSNRMKPAVNHEIAGGSSTRPAGMLDRSHVQCPRQKDRSPLGNWDVSSTIR